MKWKYETYDQQEKRLEKWHPWFAWYPVSSNGTGFWLEWTFRKKEKVFVDWYIWHYRKYDPIEVLEMNDSSNPLKQIMDIQKNRLDRLNNKIDEERKTNHDNSTALLEMRDVKIESLEKCLFAMQEASKDLVSQLKARDEILNDILKQYELNFQAFPLTEFYERIKKLKTS